MTMPDSFVVPVSRPDGTLLEAILEPASAQDMPIDWLCNWPLMWQDSDFACQAIVKMSVDTTLWGLIRYGVYPYPIKDGIPSFLYVENIESHPSRSGAVSRTGRVATPPDFSVCPVGKWLIWHACRTALDICSNYQSLVTLSSSGETVGYYRDKISMNLAGSAPAAPGEDGYAFTFGKIEAMAFCARLQAECGEVRRLDRE
jgi:hypothetical protein